MKGFFLSTLFLITLSCFSQNTEKDLYNKAESYLEALYSRDKDYLPSDIDKTNLKSEEDLVNYCITKASQIFKHLSETYPNSEEFIIYQYYVAELSDNISEKKMVFEKVVRLESKWGYYKRKSFLRLAWIAIDEKDFQKCMTYLKEIEKLPNPSFTCGVEQETYDTQLRNLYAACEKGLKK